MILPQVKNTFNRLTQAIGDSAFGQCETIPRFNRYIEVSMAL